MHDLTDSHPQEIEFHEYIDDELSSFEREQFESHLFNCQYCAQTLSALEELFSQIEGLPNIEYADDISPSIVEEINRFIEIEPLIKRTAWVQIGIISILMAALFSLVSIDSIQSNLSNILSNWGSSIATNASAISEYFASLLSKFSGLEIHIFHPWDFVSTDYISITLLLTITLISGLLWFIGNRILLPNLPISNSPNGG